MVPATSDYDHALDLCRLQLDCVVNDDRLTQLGLYSEDLHYEFPFANDRPRLIDGRDAFRKVMEPIWERRRKNKMALLLGKFEFHATDEVGLYLAVFELKAVTEADKEPVSSLCVQLLRIHDGHIVEVREFFEP